MNKTTGSIAALALVSATAIPVLAQDAGGVLLTFGLDQNISLIDNQALAATSAGTTLRTTTDLSATLRSETAHSSLSLSAVTALNGVDRPGGQGFDLVAGDPRFTLRYSQTTAASRLSANLSYIERDQSFIDPLTDFRDDDGNIVFTEDFIDLTGTGTQQSLSYGASLEIRRDRPLGLTFDASVLDINYVDADTAFFVDSTRTNVGTTARLDITPVTQASLGLNFERVENALRTTDSTTFDAGLTFDRPTGSLGFGFTATDTQGGTRLNLRFSRDLQLPGDVTVGATLGFTQPAVGNQLYFTGALSYARPLIAGDVSARFNRSFATNSDGLEEVQTSLSARATHALTPLAVLGLNASLAQTELTETQETTTITSLGTTLTYQLSPDWEVEAGLSYETRDTSATARTDRSTISINFGRDFSFRP